MRVTINLTVENKKRFEEIMKDPLMNNKTIAIRMSISLGLLQLLQGKKASLKGKVQLKFNTGTIDPMGIFGVVAYYIISKQLGASKKNKKVILASKKEIVEKIAEAFILGLEELYDYNWS
ncbi:MAG: hypothetical protein ACFFG0_38670 [Candidatus Thorarchaeota archaeon]